MTTSEQEVCMDRALWLARAALAKGDWPVAAVIARDGNILAEGQGQTNSRHDPTWHAELDALRKAAARRIDISGATLYSTMEPCPMCAWAIQLSGISRVVLGARHRDLRRTDLGNYSLEAFAALMGYQMVLVEGVRHAECIALRQRWGKDPVAEPPRHV
jgi:tRNA(adenine34) deaminase